MLRGPSLGRALTLGLAVMYLGLGAAQAHPDHAPAPPPEEDAAPAAAEPAEPSLFEITFGTSVSFPAGELFDRTDNVELVATPALLLTAELFLDVRWRVMLSYHLPTSADTRTVDGVVVERVLESNMELGLVWVPAWIDFATSSRAEFQFFATVGIEMSGETRAFPRFGFRINLLQDATSGVGVNLGLSYAAVIDRAAMFYGIGYRF